MTLLYEDKVVRALLAVNGAANGHVLVQPQRPTRRLSELTPEESDHLFLVASYAAAILFQGLKAEGTNIIINEEEERLTAHVVARSSSDGLSFTWEPRKLDEAVMVDAQERIKDAAFPIGKGAQGNNERKRGPDPPPDTTPLVEGVTEAEATENYLIKQLIRIP